MQMLRESSLWRKDPRIIEELLIGALNRPGVSGQIRSDLQISLAASLMHQHRLKEARSLLLSVIENDPGNQQALWYEAELGFFLEDPWPMAWDRLEARWELAYTGSKSLKSTQIWDGSPLFRRALVFAGEGGLGDQIQFIRFAPLLKSAGADPLIVWPHQSLLPLFDGVAGVDSLVGSIDLANCELGLPMLSAPRALRITKTSLPKASPYLRVPANRVALAREQIFDSDSTAFRIGLCWRAGLPARSLPLELFAPLAWLRSVRLFGLGEESSIGNEMIGFPITSLASSDILATAAAISVLDLVITVDTMVAHLAGSLAKQTWLLLHYLPDWRWGLAGDSTPWYPTMRLFRQQSYSHGWELVIQNIATALKEKVRQAS